MQLRAIVAALLSAVAITCAADSPTYAIDAHIISTGTLVHAKSACFGMDAVIAEPVAGFSSGGVYDLVTGFAGVSPTVNDTIFADGFEDCTP
jgi:cystathionine beta-lyase family protein involved in aluminum resistance